MKVRNLIAILAEFDQEAEVSLFTEWEGETFMTPMGAAFVAEGICPKSDDPRNRQPVVVVYAENVPSCVANVSASRRRGR